MSPIRNGATVAFKNVGTGTCIDLTESNPADNTHIIGYQYNGTKNQHWRLEQVGTTGPWPVYMIKNLATGTYIVLPNGGKDSGTPIVGWQGGNTSNDHQRWRFITADPDTGEVVMIQNVGTGTFIDLYNGGSANSTKILGWAGEPGVNAANTPQQWKVVSV
ncbi:hypothetical protein SCUP234_09471 [Seiridium cupressi]